MDIKVKYSEKEVSGIVLEHHIKTFGVAPEGEKWACSGDYYSGYKVENVKIKPETEARTEA